jgi:hypothetical protein
MVRFRSMAKTIAQRPTVFLQLVFTINLKKDHPNMQVA